MHRLMRIPLWVLLPFLLLYPPTFAPLVDAGRSFPISVQLYILTGVGCALGLLGCRAVAPVRRQEFSPFLVLLVPVAAAVTHGRFDGLKVSLPPLAVIAAVVTYAAAFTRRDTAGMRRLLTWASFLGAGISVFALWQYAARSWGIYDDLVVGGNVSTGFDGRAAGTLGHPIIFAAVVGALALAAMALRLRWWPLTVLCAVAGIAVSGARGPAAASVVFIVLVLLVRLARNRGPQVIPVHRTMTTLAVLAAASITLLLSEKARTLTAGFLGDLAGFTTGRLLAYGHDISTLARQARVDRAWELITSGPDSFILGYGPGWAFSYSQRTSFGDTQSAVFDNTYLTLWIDLGLVGLVAIGLLVLAAVRRDWLAALPAVGLLVMLAGFDIFIWSSVLCVLGVLIGYCWGSPSRAGRRDAADELADTGAIEATST